MSVLGRLERIADIRRIWPHEERDFSAWLAQDANLSLLSETLGLGAGVLELEGVETAVGGYRADIVCRFGMADDDFVVIENQFGTTDHDHLGKITTYAAGVSAKTVIWVAERFRDEHRAALDWLNTVSTEDHAFFGVEIQLWRIAQSPPAPRFNVVARPNRFARATVAAVRGRDGTRVLSALNELQFRYWSAFGALLEGDDEAPRMGKPQAQSWQPFAIGRSGFLTSAVMSARDKWIGVELYLGGKAAKAHFDWLHDQKDVIEAAFGSRLDWQRLDDKTDCRIAFRQSEVDPTDESKWRDQHEWLSVHLKRLRTAVQPYVKACPRDLPETQAATP